MLVSQRTADELLAREGKEKLAADILTEVSAPLGFGPVPKRRATTRTPTKKPACQSQPCASRAVLQLHHSVSREGVHERFFLSQEEVDALLEGVTGESQRSEVVEVDLGQVRSYDISSQERIVRGRMPTMEIVNERFARNFRIGLFNFIRRSPEVSVGTVTVQRYSAFLRELAVPTNFNIMAIRPCAAMA
jgi:hypothetical protein